MYKNLDRKQDVGHFFCLLDVDAFLDAVDRVARMITVDEESTPPTATPRCRRTPSRRTGRRSSFP